MPEPIDLNFGNMSISSSGSSDNSRVSPPAGRASTDAAKSSTSSKLFGGKFLRDQMDQFKSKVMVSGSWHNVLTFSFLTFVVVVVILVVFRPPLVMQTPKPTEQVPHPKPCLSWASVLTWSALMALVVGAVGFFTRPKAAPNYVLEK